MDSIRLAYLIVAHKCPEQVSAFINQLLEYGDCDVYIHVDKKNQALLTSLKEKYSTLQRQDDRKVYICSVYGVRWGSFEIVKAVLELMRMAHESGRRYTHMYFGSGQDLLVKRGMYEYLGSKPNVTFIRIEKEVKNSDRGSAKYRVRWPHRLMIRNDLHVYRFIRGAMQLLCGLGIVVQKNRRELKKSVRFYEGHTWFIAPYKVLEYILKYTDKYPDYVEFWEDSLASDLMFFHTLIMNSPYKGKIEDELMYVEFGKTFATNNHPVRITEETLNRIEDGNYFCARKFEWEEDQKIITYFLKNTD